MRHKDEEGAKEKDTWQMGRQEMFLALTIAGISTVGFTVPARAATIHTSPLVMVQQHLQSTYTRIAEAQPIIGRLRGQMAAKDYTPILFNSNLAPVIADWARSAHVSVAIVGDGPRAFAVDFSGINPQQWKRTISDNFIASDTVAFPQTDRDNNVTYVDIQRTRFEQILNQLEQQGLDKSRHHNDQGHAR